MPQNIAIKLGVIVLVASALLWVGAELTQRIEWILPYTAAASVVLIVLGVLHELWKGKSHPPDSSTEGHQP